MNASNGMFDSDRELSCSAVIKILSYDWVRGPPAALQRRQQSPGSLMHEHVPVNNGAVIGAVPAADRGSHWHASLSAAPQDEGIT